MVEHSLFKVLYVLQRYLGGKRDNLGKLFYAKCSDYIRFRLYHLKGYYTLVKYNHYKRAMKYLRKAKRIADKQHNELELSWIDHSEMVTALFADRLLKIYRAAILKKRVVGFWIVVPQVKIKKNGISKCFVT